MLNKCVDFKNSTMLSGELSQNNNIKEPELKKQSQYSCKSTQLVKICSTLSTSLQGSIQAVPHLSINKMRDQYAVGIIHSPHRDIDHETEWDEGYGKQMQVNRQA